MDLLFKSQRCEERLREVTPVNDTVTEIMHAAKDEAAPALEISEAPDSKMEEEEEEEAEVPTEADGKEAEEDDGIHMIFPQ